MAMMMDAETLAKLRADLREEIIAEVHQRLIPVVRALVQEVTDSVKIKAATARIDPISRRHSTGRRERTSWTVCYPP